MFFIRLFSSALLLQCISGQFIGLYNTCGWEGSLTYDGVLARYGGCGCGLRSPLVVDWTGITAARGGGFTVSSASPIVPVGLSVLSDNEIEGALAVGGALPYLGAVALEAALPTVGTGAVAYGCGNGVVVTAEDIGGIGFAGVAGPLGYVPGITGPIGLGFGRSPCTPFL